MADPKGGCKFFSNSAQICFIVLYLSTVRKTSLCLISIVQFVLLDTIWMGTSAQNVPEASGSWRQILFPVTVV